MDSAPHRVVLFVQAEVHELMPSGECIGNACYEVNRFAIYFDGEDKNIAIRKCNEFVAELKKNYGRKS